MRPNMVCMTLLLSLLSACAAQTSTGEDSDSETHESCDCVVDRFANAGSLACGEPLCPAIMSGSTYDPEQGMETPIEPDPAAVDCALEALRDRTPGIIELSSTYSLGQGSTYVLIDADGLGLTRTWSLDDLYEETSDAVVGELRAPSEFDDCLALEDVYARIDCVRMARETEVAVCDEGWDELYG